MSNKVKIAFIGTGGMGQKAHLWHYSYLDSCEVVALAEPRVQLGQAVAKRYNIPHVYTDHKELLANVKVDAIVSAQPYAHNVNLYPDILNAGLHLMSEKPIAIAPESGAYLAGLAEKNNVIYMVGYHKRSDPASEYAKNLILEWKQSGEFGKMKYVRFTMPPGDWVGGGFAGLLGSDEPYPPIKTEPAPDYFTPEIFREYDGFVNYYIHQVNLMRFMLGENYTVQYADKTDMLMVVQSASGVPGILEKGIYSTQIDWQESYMICFDNAWIRVELPQPLANQIAGTVTVYRGATEKNPQPTCTTPVLPRVSAMQNQAANFIRAINGEKPAPCQAREAVEDLRTAVEYTKLRYGC